MRATFAFTSLHDAATRLREAARVAKTPLNLLAYRRFDPEAEDTWWLAPTPSNPAYADGKIVVERPNETSPGQPLIGLHVEKGVGPTAEPVFDTPRGTRLVMQRDWIWNPFLREMSTGGVARDLAVASEAAGDLPLFFVVRTEIQDVPRLEAEEDRDRFAAELVWYRPVDDRLELVGKHQPDALARLLSKEETVSSIAEKIASLNDLDWRWIEIFAGIPFERVSSGGLSASEVWRRACVPWLRWVR